MKSATLKVLLVEPDKIQKEVLTDILIGLDFQVVSAKNVESAIKKLLEISPGLIICQNDLNEYSGFHFYNILHNKMMGHRLPFILLINEFNKDDLSVGIELGIDSFLFPPFEEEKIRNILHKQLQKSIEWNADAEKQLRTIFNDTPFGIFVLKNRKIVDANPRFYKLIEKSNPKNHDFTLTDLFNFNNGHSSELKLLRCLNGIEPSSSFQSVPLNFDSTKRFNIYLSFLENRASWFKMIGLLVSDDTISGKNGRPIGPEILERNRILKKEQVLRVQDAFFTKRETQVLQLSAQGSPVKQIAAQLGISVRTVEKHRSNIISKTKTANITEAVFYAHKKQLLNLK